MYFLSLYTPAAASGGPPSEEKMGQMYKLIEKMTKSGVLIRTGGVRSRDTAMKVTQKNGASTVKDGAIDGSSLMAAGGYALLRVNSRDELARVTKEFLEVAGDGTCELIQLMEMDEAPPQTK